MRFRKHSGSSRWGMILAGGEGARLRSLTRRLSGDDRPKQFCKVLGDHTLIESTRRRLNQCVSNDRILFSLSDWHRPYFESSGAIQPNQRLIQPGNRGTAPPIAHGLQCIAEQDQDATVAVLPCDHHYENDQAFLDALERAYRAAEAYPDKVILLGAAADYPEVEYGWIDMGSPAACGSPGLYEVLGFQEKPSFDRAQELLRRGSVWNTFVMVGSVGAFLSIIEQALPELDGHFQGSRLAQCGETRIQDGKYDQLAHLNFSQHVLENAAQQMLVLKLQGAGWSDLGDPTRAMAATRSSEAMAHSQDKYSNADTLEPALAG